MTPITNRLVSKLTQSNYFSAISCRINGLCKKLTGLKLRSTCVTCLFTRKMHDDLEVMATARIELFLVLLAINISFGLVLHGLLNLFWSFDYMTCFLGGMSSNSLESLCKETLPYSYGTCHVINHISDIHTQVFSLLR